MIGDETRREVAIRLRGVTEKELCYVFLGEILNFAVGGRCLDDEGDIDERFILNRLADLIDRPTCKNVADPYDGSHFECSRCGEKWELTCGSPADNHLNYCPDCGAEVIGCLS